MGSMKISTNLCDTEKFLKRTLGESSDIIYRPLIISVVGKRRALLLYIDGLIGTKEIDDTILRPLMENESLPSIEFLENKDIDIMEEIMKAHLVAPSVKESEDLYEVLDSVLSGDTALFLEQSSKALIISTRGWESRGVSEPSSESEIRGAKDCFIENIRSNTALVRRRIKDYNLRFESIKLGKRTKTDIAITYIDGIADKKILQEVRERLGRINIDGIIASGYIAELIDDSPYSLFSQIQNTERPDKACAALLEGRIVIIVDNAPFVLIVPTVFWQYLQAPGDYYSRYYIGSFERWIRFSCLILSITATSLYVMLTSFHQEMLPTVLALRIAAGREGVPFPAAVEAFGMEIMFEIMREAGIRMPKAVGQAVSIVGALVIGEAAVNAGLVGPTLVVVVAASGICSFAIPAYDFSFSWRLAKFFVLLCTSLLGLLGFLASGIMITLHLLGLRSFGAPFMAPLSPFYHTGNKDTVIRAPWWKMKFRPRTGKPEERDRQGEEIGPKPPQN